MPRGDLRAEKAELRKRFLAIRRAATDAETRSGHIRQFVESLDAYKAAPKILTYVSKPDEVDTHGLIECELERDRQVYVPAASQDGNLAWFRLHSLADLTPSRYGVLEPRPEDTMDPIATFPDTSVVLVPGAVFSRSGFRIGHGGGYFDRFLANFPGVPVGLAFACQVTDDLPYEPHDQRVRWLVTEEGVVDCGSA